MTETRKHPAVAEAIAAARYRRLWAELGLSEMPLTGSPSVDEQAARVRVDKQRKLRDRTLQPPMKRE